MSFRCRIFGFPGDAEKRMRQYISEHDLDGKVDLVDYVEPAAFIATYRTATVFVMPTIASPGESTDGLPNVVLEAMACGLPVIASRAAGIPEAIEDDQSGILVEPCNPSELALAIAKALADEPLRSRLASVARRVVQERFDLRKCGDRLYRTLMDTDNLGPSER